MTEQVSMGFPSPFCKKEGWQPPTVCGLQGLEQGHQKGQIPSQFNLKIWFRPRQLGAKPDALTCWWDVYGDRMVECNVQPIFSSKQVDNLEFPVRTGTLEESDMGAMEIMDTNQLMKNIKEAMESDPLTINILQKLDSTT